MIGYSRMSSPVSTILFWKLEEGSPTHGDIERSEVPHEGFVTLAEDIDLTDERYVDTFDVPNENRTYYYKVAGNLLNVGGIPTPQAKEVVRRDRWFLSSSRRHSGARDALVKVRRIEGNRCKHCWDSVQQKITKSKCDVCFGTGVENPYYSSVKIKVARPSPAKRRIPQPDQIDQISEPQLWTSNYILLKPGDLLKLEGFVYRVEQVHFSRSEGYVIKQALATRRMEVHREEYRVPWEAGVEIG